VSGHTRKEVRDKLAELKRQNALHELVPPVRLTLAQFLDEWLAAGGLEWKPRTRVGYQSLIKEYWGPALGDVRLQRLSAPMIAACYTRWRDERNVTGGTLLNAHRCLRRALRVAVLWGFLGQNPADRVEAPKARRAVPDLWPVAEAQRFLSVTDRTRWHTLWAVLIGTGCRMGEALELRWSDIDLENGGVKIRRSVSQVKLHERLVTEPKTAAGTRRVAAPPWTLTSLRRWRARQAEERLALGDAWVGDDLLFTDPEGTPVRHWQVRWAFEKACRDGGFERIRLHDLRHLSASLLIAKGVPLPAVARRLGHANPQVTATIYAHAFDSGDAEAATALGEALG